MIAMTVFPLFFPTGMRFNRTKAMASSGERGASSAHENQALRANGLRQRLIENHLRQIRRERAVLEWRVTSIQIGPEIT
jgi:hypothetical protein